MIRPPQRRPQSGQSGLSEEKPDIIRGARNNDLAEVEAALLDDELSINTQDQSYGMTALHYAAAKGNIEMVEFLVAQDELDMTLEDRWGRDAMDVAILAGSRAVIEVILDRAGEAS